MITRNELNAHSVAIAARANVSNPAFGVKRCSARFARL
jgi:hypothetical protein